MLVNGGLIPTFIVVTLPPIVVVYPFVQKHFAKGMLTGAIKG